MGSWLFFALGSAFFAGLTAVLAKCGIRSTDSTVATAIRTIVVVAFSWLMVFIVGSQGSITSVTAPTLLALVLSGLATGASWLCYFRALQLGDINKVVPIDKSSVVLTMLLAFIFLREPVHVPQFLGMVAIAVGTFMMIQKKASPAPLPVTAAASVSASAAASAVAGGHATSAGSASGPSATYPAQTAGSPAQPAQPAARHSWLFYAVLSAVFAALTSILGKLGITDIESNLGTAIRTVVVLAMAWLMVFISRKQSQLRGIPGRELIFILLSGVATGASWLCFYRALQTGPASIVVPIDKLSILVSIAFAYVVFHEKLSAKSALGLVLVVAGTLALLL